VDLPVIEGDWSADSGYIAGSRLDPRATAVFCANDQMATGVVHALADRGLSVPRDVSVVGFDDIPESQHSMPPLTTVHQDFDGVGRVAVEVLVARLDGEATPDYPPFQPWLVTRGSTGPRAASA
jgi:DNA-binding LacI/PurR family transcriptional regulator